MKKFVTLVILIFSLSLTCRAQALFTYSNGGTTPVPQSYFGVSCTHPLQATPSCISVGTFITTDASESGVGLAWGAIETSSGVYSWTVLDSVVAIAQAAPIADIIYTIEQVPVWNSSNPTGTGCAAGNGTCYPNASTAEFVTFMNALTQRYCGVIQFYGGWNEANTSSFWNASIPLLVSYMSAAYTAVHSTANCACVGAFSSANCAPAKAGGSNLNQLTLPPLNSPAFFTITELFGSVGGNGYNINLSYWLKTYLANGGDASADIWALHSYGSNATCYAGPEIYVTDFASFQQAFATAGLSPKPIWASELNWGLNTCVPSGTNQNSWIARYLLLHWAIGAARTLWYTYDGPAGNSFGLIASGSTQLTTYQDMQLWMTGAVEQNCIQFVNSNWTCSLTRNGGYQAYAVWNSTGSGSYTVPAGITQYRDVLNNITSTSGGSVISLTTSPLLFETGSVF